MNTLTISEVESVIGADIYVNSIGDYYLDELGITDFLQQQKEADDQAVTDFTFVSANTNRIFGTLVNYYYTRITNVSSFGHSKVDLYSVSQNYLNVADTKYYVPNTV